MYVSNSWEHILNESDDMRPFLNDLIADIGMTSGCMHAGVDGLGEQRA